jgi:hypothetical protein
VIPDKVLVCPTCWAQQGEMAFQGLQREFLRKAARHEFGYSVRIAKGNEKHVLMYSSFTRTFCGKDLQVKPQIHYEAYDDDTLAKVCAGCRIAIAGLMQEAMP